MRLTKMNQRVFMKLLNRFQKDFPGQKLPDNGHVENRYVASGDNVSISSPLKYALLDNSTDYQEFKKNNPKLFSNPARPGRGFAQFEKEFLGLTDKKPPTSIFGGGRSLNNY